MLCSVSGYLLPIAGAVICHVHGFRGQPTEWFLASQITRHPQNKGSHLYITRDTFGGVFEEEPMTRIIKASGLVGSGKTRCRRQYLMDTRSRHLSSFHKHHERHSWARRLTAIITDEITQCRPQNIFQSRETGPEPSITLPRAFTGVWFPRNQIRGKHTPPHSPDSRPRQIDHPPPDPKRLQAHLKHNLTRAQVPPVNFSRK